MQQLRDHDTVCTGDNDGSSAYGGRTTSPENELSVNSPLIVVPTSGEAASSSAWTTEDVTDQNGGQQLVQQAGPRRQFLASVGNESSFFRKDAISDEHLCSTPSHSDDIDDRMLSSQQTPSSPPDWICTCLLYTSPSPRDGLLSRMPSSA